VDRPECIPLLPIWRDGEGNRAGSGLLGLGCAGRWCRGELRRDVVMLGECVRWVPERSETPLDEPAPALWRAERGVNIAVLDELQRGVPPGKPPPYTEPPLELAVSSTSSAAASAPPTLCGLTDREVGLTERSLRICMSCFVAHERREAIATASRAAAARVNALVS